MSRGVAHDLSWNEYRQLKMMNPSTLVHGCRSMLRLRRMIDKGYEDEKPLDKPAQRLGSAIHALTLEPDKFEERFCKMPDFHLMPQNKTAKGEASTSKSTKFYKESVDSFLASNPGKEIIEQYQYDTALHCIESLRDKSHMVELIDQSDKEVSLFGEVFGLPMRGRVDMLLNDGNPMIVDLKTTFDCSPHQFGRTFCNLHYPFKMAIYRELFRQNFSFLPTVMIIAQEVGGDFDNALYPVEPIVLDNALTRVQSVVSQYIEACNKNTWHGVDRGEMYCTLHIPNWAMEQSDEVDWSGIEEGEEIAEESYF